MGFIELESWLRIPWSPLEKSTLTALLGTTAGMQGGQRWMASSARRGQGKGTGGEGEVCPDEGILGQREERTQQVFRNQSRPDL